MGLNPKGIYVLRLWHRGCHKHRRSRSEEQILNIFAPINLGFGLLAAVAGCTVLGGLFQRPLSSTSTARFLRWSLVASLAGLMPFTRHLMPVQQVCMLSVYCSAAAIVA